jgi:2-polyprenylphenol 6-hydroxylase
MSRRDGFDIVVIGAGIVGSAAALALAQAGFQVALVDEREPPAWSAADEVDLRVVAMAPSSLALFGHLDVWTTIAAQRVCPYRRMHVWDAGSSAMLDFDAGYGDQDAMGYIVENRLIQSVLWDAVKNESKITVRCPVRVIALDDSPAGRNVVLDSGGQLRTRLVVAADGSGSPLRHLAGIQTHGHDYQQSALVANVTHERPHEYTAWQRFLPGGPLAFLPLQDGRSSIVWSLPADQAQRLRALDPAAFCAQLGAAFDFRLGVISQCSARVVFPLRLQLADRYMAAHFALIGDAAHAVHPLAGQGANLGLRDVAALVEVLADARTAGADFAAKSTLRKYERWRKSENTLAARGFDGINRLFGSNSDSLVWLRGIGMRAVNALGPLKNALADRAAGRSGRVAQLNAAPADRGRVGALPKIR